MSNSCKTFYPNRSDSEWYYLKGMAEIRKTSFTIFPESWADCCGDRFYERSGYKLKERFNGIADIGAEIPYGWTVGLSVPSEEHIKAEIEGLAAELVS